MEILPHFWVNYYHNNSLNIIKNKNISCIIHLSKYEKYIKRKDLEELRIPIDYNIDDSLENINNIFYQQLFDITNFIHEKVFNTKNVLILGYDNRQDIDVIIVAYFIRYGKLNIIDAINMLKSKKKNIFYPKCTFFISLNKFYTEINKLNR
jgi:hypothetical protein